jgi:hypothetical protein
MCPEGGIEHILEAALITIIIFITKFSIISPEFIFVLLSVPRQHRHPLNARKLDSGKELISALQGFQALVIFFICHSFIYKFN